MRMRMVVVVVVRRKSLIQLVQPESLEVPSEIQTRYPYISCSLATDEDNAGVLLFGGFDTIVDGGFLSSVTGLQHRYTYVTLSFVERCGWALQ